MMPVRSEARIVWYPPESDLQPDKWHRTQTYWFAEAHVGNKRRDVTEPPTPSQRFWRTAETSDIYPLPELKGAILTPYQVGMDTETRLQPLDSNGVPVPWVSEFATTGRWALSWQEGLQCMVAAYNPQVGDTSGKVRTTGPLGGTRDGYEPAGRSFFVRYRLNAPVPTGGVDPAHGLRVYMGKTSRGYQYMMDLAAPTEGVAGSNVWTLYGQGGTVLDKVPGFGRGASTSNRTNAEWTLLWFIVVGNRLLVREATEQHGWVYAPQYGFELRGGRVELEFYGTGGQVQYGHMLFDREAVVRGAENNYPAWWGMSVVTCTASLLTTFYDNPPGDATASGAFVSTGPTSGYPRLTVTNHSIAEKGTLRRRTPLLLALQEIHRPTWTSIAADPINITAHAEALTYTVNPKGRGHTANIDLRRIEGLGQESTLDELIGMGRVQVELRHNFAGSNGDWVTVFTGFARRLDRSSRNDLHGYMRLALQDATVLLDGKSCAAFIPFPGGMDLKQFVLYATEAHGIHPNDVSFPANYSLAPRTVPFQDGSASVTFDPGTELTQVLDRVCELCWYRWYINPSGKLVFESSPSAPGAVAFTVDQATATDMDRLREQVAAGIDFGEVVTVSYVRGRNEFGFTLEGLNADLKAMDDQTSPRYVGRALWRFEFQDDNSTPSTTSQRNLYRAMGQTRVVEWNTVGRGLWIRDVVQCDQPDIGVPVGTKFVLRGKEGQLKLSKESMVWIEQYTGDVLEGNFVE